MSRNFFFGFFQNIPDLFYKGTNQNNMPREKTLKLQTGHHQVKGKPVLVKAKYSPET